jgi:hypothetical protein
LLPQLPTPSLTIGDKGYVSQELSAFLKTFGIEFSHLEEEYGN